MYELPLTPSGDPFPAIDFAGNERIKDELERIPDFEKRLIYYNENVESLSIYFHKVQIYFEWHYDKPAIKIFCNCNNCEAEKEFTGQEKIFLKHRDKEVKRITGALEKALTYEDKLKFIFSVKGYRPDRVPAIYPNMAKTKPVYLAKATIDLSPKNEAERTIYNEFVKAEFDKIVYDENGFTKEYKDFDFKRERQRLDNSLRISPVPKDVLNHYKGQIEDYFNFAEVDKNENVSLNEINSRIDGLSISRELFQQKMFGEEIDLNRIVLNTDELLYYTHVSQIFNFYCYVKNLIESPQLIQDFKGEGNEEYVMEAESKNYPAKYYALYHWMKIDMGGENNFTKNENDQFRRSEIEAYAKAKYPECSEQGFYRSFIGLDITNYTAIANDFGNGYKEILISISNNDNKLITYLKKYPN